MTTQSEAGVGNLFCKELDSKYITTPFCLTVGKTL